MRLAIRHQRGNFDIVSRGGEGGGGGYAVPENFADKKYRASSPQSSRRISKRTELRMLLHLGEVRAKMS